jgi:opacity protein-like surface antigen
VVTFVAWVAWVAVIASPNVVRADEATGTWTGAVEGRANYYWERSTRVVVPAVKAQVTSPNGVRVGAGYLLDVITSASIAQTGGDSDGLFTEYRNAFNADVGKAFDLGKSELDVSLSGTYSTEDDYQSLVYGLASSLSLAEKTTKLTLLATRVQDRVQSNADATFDKSLSGFTVGAGVEQVVNPRLVLMLNYQFGYLQGFLANAYRRALIGPLPYPEKHPDTRVRHAALARAAWAVPNTQTSIHVLLGGYADSWDIAALSPELRVYQQIGPDLLLSPRYRFYAQTASDFARARCGEARPLDAPGCGPPGSYPVGWTGPITNDPKMDAFTTNTLGIGVEYRLSFLSRTVLDFAKDAWIDVGFDRYWSTSAFGSGVLGTAGGRLVF